jgi:uncharacterized membrane protein
MHVSVWKIIIIVGGILILCGAILGLPVSSRFMLLLGHDSVLPNAIDLFYSLTKYDYLLIFFTTAIIIAGMLIFWVGIMLMCFSSKRKT